jgi:hypothetical protein
MLLLKRTVSVALNWLLTKLRWFFDLIYGSTPVEFQSAFDIDESVEKLSAASKWFTLNRQLAEGDVSEHDVSLRRPYDWGWDLRRGCEPWFKGEFQKVDGRTVLIGRFTSSFFMKLFCTVWFGAFFLGIGFFTLALLRTGDVDLWWVPLLGIVIIALVLANLLLRIRYARHDIPWLRKLIQDALSEETTHARSGMSSPDSLPTMTKKC